ncbi:MAG: 3-hydroxy-5-phosphonooxypentane-2,4-dione thiolase [Candidatus Aenigmarchaeota archaeon]|nr:3-hydroxy-5-phosphonooxypentane-2,4-dione thiolase [Candidatus Aenigmarchaeota archaeon]
MDWGFRNRMAQIVRPSTGRSLMLAVDHGYFMGPTHGLEKPWDTVKALVPYADCLALTRGVLRHAIPPEADIPIILRVSGGTSILSKELLREGIITSMQDALRLNVAGVAFSILVGSPHERDTLLNLAKVVDEAEEYGIPVLAITAVGKDMVRDARYLSLACRIAGELGAHLVKTYYCDGFEQVVEGCPVPIVIAGGKKIPEFDALQMAHQALRAGAIGVDMGRNIFQSESPQAMIRAVRAVIHDRASPEDGMEIYNRFKGPSLPLLKETQVTA